MFDMMEYYESATRLNIAGNHAIGVRGWQACSHMIKRVTISFEVYESLFVLIKRCRT